MSLSESGYVICSGYVIESCSMIVTCARISIRVVACLNKLMAAFSYLSIFATGSRGYIHGCNGQWERCTT